MELRTLARFKPDGRLLVAFLGLSFIDLSFWAVIIGQMAKRKAKGFKSVPERLPAVLRQFGLGDKIAVYQAVADWSLIAGEGLARHSRAIAVEDKTLVVAVDSPAWMAQLYYLKGELLLKISRHIGKGLITDVRFVLKSNLFNT